MGPNVLLLKIPRAWKSIVDIGIEVDWPIIKISTLRDGKDTNTDSFSVDDDHLL
jgi:hypothetical protein